MTNFLTRLLLRPIPVVDVRGLGDRHHFRFRSLGGRAGCRHHRVARGRRHGFRGRRCYDRWNRLWHGRGRDAERVGEKRLEVDFLRGRGSDGGSGGRAAAGRAGRAIFFFFFLFLLQVYARGDFCVGEGVSRGGAGRGFRSTFGRGLQRGRGGAEKRL